MQFKEGNLQFTEELKFTDNYGRFSKAEMSNFSDPGNMENRKQDQKNFAPEKCTPTKNEQDFKEKDADIWMVNERSGESYREEIVGKEQRAEAETSEKSKSSDKNTKKDQSSEGKEKAARKTMVARMIRAKNLFSENRGEKETTGREYRSCQGGYDLCESQNMGEDTGSKTGGCAGTTYPDCIYVSYRDISSDNDCGRNVFYDKYRYRKGNRVFKPLFGQRTYFVGRKSFGGRDR